MPIYRLVRGAMFWLTVSTLALVAACAVAKAPSTAVPPPAMAGTVAGAPPATAGTMAGAPPATASGTMASPAAGGSPATAGAQSKPAIGVAYWATPQPIVDKMLELAAIKSGDIVYDLGCGDARSLVTAAARYGARGVGVDINPQRVAEARANVRRSGVEHLVEIKHGDMFFVDLSQADVVFLYMLERFNQQLMPQFAKLRKGARIVAHEFPVPGVKPKRIVRIPGPPDGPPGTDEGDPQKIHSLYLWEIPWRADAK